MFFPPPQFRASFVFNPLQLSSSFSLSHPRSYHSDTTQKYSCSPLLVLIQGLHGRFNLHRVPLLFKTSVELLFPTFWCRNQDGAHLGLLKFFLRGISAIFLHLLNYSARVASHFRPSSHHLYPSTSCHHHLVHSPRNYSAPLILFLI